MEAAGPLAVQSPGRSFLTMQAAARTGWSSVGIRVLTLRTGGIPESLPENMEGAGEIADAITGSTMLGRAVTLNISAGALIDR